MTKGWHVGPLCDIDGKVILDKQRQLLDTFDKIWPISSTLIGWPITWLKEFIWRIKISILHVLGWKRPFLHISVNLNSRTGVWVFVWKRLILIRSRSVVVLRILYRFSENGDNRQGNKWRVFDPYWTANIILSVSNGKTHVTFFIPRIEPLDSVSVYRSDWRWVILYDVIIIWPQWKDIESRLVIKRLSVAKRPLNRPIRIVFDQTGNYV